MPVESEVPLLRPGDAVALIAPASGQKADEQHLIREAIALLQGWGLRVVQTPTLNTERYLAADDITRAAALRRALTHPDIKAIFTTRGGYGCARLLPQLTDIVVPTPRLLLGFSDITTLHLHFAEQENLYRVHAPNLATRQCLARTADGETNRQALYHALFAGKYPILTLTPLNRQAKQNDKQYLRAPLTGGCLSLTATSLGTAHQIQTTGKILLIEEIGESPYKIDRLLTHLKNTGLLHSVAGVMVADMIACDSSGIAIDALLPTLLSEIDCPLWRCTGIGHGTVNLPWLYDRPFRSMVI